MPETISMSPDQPIGTLTIGELQELIATTVRNVIRKEMPRDYYINDAGIKVLYAEEDIDPQYLTELNQYYEKLRRGQVQTISGELVLEELRELGVGV